MKNVITLLFIAFSTMALSQVGIGTVKAVQKSDNTSANTKVKQRKQAATLTKDSLPQLNQHMIKCHSSAQKNIKLHKKKRKKKSRF